MEARFNMAAARLWRGLVDVVTPSQCLGCGEPLREPASLCVTCWNTLTHLDDPVCDMLGTPFAYEQGPGALSPAALANPPPWDRARAAVAFDDASRKLIHALKYNDRQEAGLLMARMMARAGRALIADADIILPVPLYRWRLWRRRFNQSAYLARELASSFGKVWRGDLLLRRRRTRSQVGLDLNARKRNVKGAFSLTMEGAALVNRRNVLLIDDVRTTGATSAACAEVLKAAGAAHVSFLTFALVLAPAKFHI
jgi:ComF family protein